MVAVRAAATRIPACNARSTRIDSTSTSLAGCSSSLTVGGQGRRWRRCCDWHAARAARARDRNGRDRVREAITVANNEIRRIAALRSEWHGMACVLTVAVVEDGRATIGHVGDTRLYKIRNGRIEKATRDHSPIGEREDARELSEFEAMRHPRRNEVYRDVGSEPHHALDPDFIDLHELPFELDAALLCSDGLTDLVDSATINSIVTRFAGRPHDVVGELIQAANDAGGKDNVRRSTSRAGTLPVGTDRRTCAQASTARVPMIVPVVDAEGESTRVSENAGNGSRTVVRLAIVVLVAHSSVTRSTVTGFPHLPLPSSAIATLPNAGAPIVVTSSDSIAAALVSAAPEKSIVVEPGEHRERLVLRATFGLSVACPTGPRSDCQPRRQKATRPSWRTVLAGRNWSGFGSSAMPRRRSERAFPRSTQSFR
jgi:serine/threonine protein phosphatase PrpC